MATSKATPHAEAQKRYMEKQQRDGAVRVARLIPQKHLEEFNKELARLRRRWARLEA